MCACVQVPSGGPAGGQAPHSFALYFREVRACVARAQRAVTRRLIHSFIPHARV
jgi:hypothetical protein